MVRRVFYSGVDRPNPVGRSRGQTRDGYEAVELLVNDAARGSRSAMDESEKLLRWFESQKRLLPWRESREPYGVWVSEIMLQQTQVQTVIPYYLSFLRQFPTVEDLAAAPLEQVLAAWSGLGYYRRARQMHSAAKMIAESLDGFPSSSRELERLPGVGPYTAAAVASIAFGEVVPVLDGNVERVMARRLALAEDPKQSAVRKALFGAAASVLDSEQPGESNQALMELGATICRPKRPVCDECPLKQDCLAQQQGNPESFPAPRRRRTIERFELAVAVVRRDSSILLFRRPEESALMAGMWELPNVPLSRSVEVMAGAFEGKYGGCWKLELTDTIINHRITYRALRLHVHLGEFKAGHSVAEGLEAAWISREEQVEYAVSSAVGKIVASCCSWY